NVIITQRDAFEVLDNIADQDGTVIYCDPPYIEKSDKYVHDLGAGDHERLAVSLSRFTEAMVVVSYYGHPLLEDLYAGWERVATKQSQQSLRNATRGPKKKPGKQQVEVLLCNKRPGGRQLFQ
ncbi:MAG: DNA adenine methylase, partial [Planctomycetes bacterium]|nr:DNA adenine methylase [Planctomycetota bacterium]